MHWKFEYAHCFLVPIAVATIAVWPTAGVRALDAKVHDNKEKPIVLILNVAENSDDQARETRFVNDLQLNLDNFRIQRSEPPVDGFTDLSLNKQIESFFVVHVLPQKAERFFIILD